MNWGYFAGIIDGEAFVGVTLEKANITSKVAVFDHA
jgi:hypothetical protein